MYDGKNKVATATTPIINTRLPLPINPVIYATLRALYAGGSDFSWESDSYGRPYYHYHSRDGHIGIFCDPPYKSYPSYPEEIVKKAADLQKLYMHPRWQFIYAGSLRDTVRKLSVETADVFLILMSRIAGLPDPRHDVARIRLEEIAGCRAVTVRRGNRQKLIEDLKQEVLLLSDLRVTMYWQDYRNSGTITFGKERPDRLLDIVDVKYKHGKEQWTAFGFRCGQALASFLNPDGLRWIGFYSKALLELSPYHAAFSKKLGTYWIMIGIPAGKKGMQPRATPRTILDFCGERPNWRNPGKTVDAFIKAHQRLQEIGVLEDTPVLEPSSRNKGYFEKWLDTPLTVQLSHNLWKINARQKKGKFLSTGKASLPGRGRETGRQRPAAPGTLGELQDSPQAIRQFRAQYNLSQAELARFLGVTRQTLSYYERGLRPLPGNTASEILALWRQKLKIRT